MMEKAIPKISSIVKFLRNSCWYPSFADCSYVSILVVLTSAVNLSYLLTENSSVFFAGKAFFDHGVANNGASSLVLEICHV
jgi:hypothetical protein